MPAMVQQQVDQARRADGSLDEARLVESIAAAVMAEARAADQRSAMVGAMMQGMPQGVCLFDGNKRLLACNDHYTTLYGLRPDQVVPGMPLEEIMGLRREVGCGPCMSRSEYRQWRRQIDVAAEPDDSVVELRNGRIITIRHQPMVGGGWVATHEDVTERRRAERHVAYMARHDGLTGLPNQALLYSFLQEALGDATLEEPCALLALDLERFRSINTTMGRASGDELIRQVADRLRQHVTDHACLTRPGGDEFAIIQTEMAQPASAIRLAERVQTALAQPFVVGGQDVVVGSSIGIAVATGSSIDPYTLIKRAGIALHRVKTRGRGSYSVFTREMDHVNDDRRRLELDLQTAVDDMSFEVHYQPQINLRSRRVTTMEALMRWRHPVRGNIPPAEFIPLAEEMGLVGRIGQWVMERACHEALAWPDEVSVAVNVSAVQFTEGALPAVILSALRTSGLPPSRLELEITESVLMESNAVTQAALRILRDAGIRVAIDDFGVGYSSLSYLASFPFDKIKIDRSFVSGVGILQDRRAIIRAVIGLCASIGMTCTAEGVETEEQLEMLIGENCMEAQGYLFGRAMPSREVSALLAKLNPAASDGSSEATPQRQDMALSGSRAR